MFNRKGELEGWVMLAMIRVFWLLILTVIQQIVKIPTELRLHRSIWTRREWVPPLRSLTDSTCPWQSQWKNLKAKRKYFMTKTFFSSWMMTERSAKRENNVSSVLSRWNKNCRILTIFYLCHAIVPTAHQSDNNARQSECENEWKFM